MSRRNVFLVVFLLAVIIALGGCKSPGDTPPPALPQPVIIVKAPLSSDEWVNWLKAVPCQAPCWDNITLGQTTVSTTLAILRDNPTINPSSVQVVRKLCGGENGEEIINSRRIVWTWVAEHYQEGGSALYERS